MFKRFALATICLISSCSLIPTNEATTTIDVTDRKGDCIIYADALPNYAKDITEAKRFIAEFPQISAKNKIANAIYEDRCKEQTKILGIY